MKSLHPSNNKPMRLDKYLMEQFPTLNFGTLNKALRQNKIKVNGKKQPLSTRVGAGDEIKLFLLDEMLYGCNEQKQQPLFLQTSYSITPIYEDEFVLLVNKPAGVPVADDSTADTLIHRAQRYLYLQNKWNPDTDDTPALCHRLDTGTSGLVIIAKTAAAEQQLLKLIREHRLKKQYLCVTFGRPNPPQAVLNGYLYKDAQQGKVYIATTAGTGAKSVETHYKTIHTSGRLALLEVNLITGRTHQIRAHMASIRCPVLGDSKYGNNTVNRELKIKYQALCAWKLTFPALESKELAGLSGKTFTVEKPWWVQQVLDGTLH